jgi:hypothetical protein
MWDATPRINSLRPVPREIEVVMRDIGRALSERSGESRMVKRDM